MALVSFWSCCKTLMASGVGKTNSLIFRRSASRRTSCITGNLPYAPLPITSWRHSQGMFSSTESGVCPNSSRNCLDAFFLRLEISPRSITTSCSYVLPSIWMEPKEKLSNCIGASFQMWSGALLLGDGRERGPALLDVLAAAVGTGDLFLLMPSNGQSLQKGFLAVTAEELVVRHTDLPSGEG